MPTAAAADRQAASPTCGSRRATPRPGGWRCGSTTTPPHQITPTRITYRDPRFRTDAARHPAAAGPVAVRARLPDPTCPPRPACDHPKGTGTVTVDVRRRRRRPSRSQDSTDVAGRYHDRALPRARDRARSPTCPGTTTVAFDGKVGRPGHADPRRTPDRRARPDAHHRHRLGHADPRPGRHRRVAARRDDPRHRRARRASTSRSSPTAATTTPSWSPAARRRSRSGCTSTASPGRSRCG